MPDNLDVSMSPTDLIRQLMAEEQDAVISYTERAKQVEDPLIRQTFLDIAEEEKEHAGELSELLSRFDPQEDSAQESGAEEVDDMDESIDKAWEEFKKSNQTSIEDKIDVLLAQNQEIKVDSARTADLVPAVMGAIADGSEPQADEMEEQIAETADDMTANGMDAEGDDADPYSVLDDLDGMEGDGEPLEEGEEESDVLDEGVSEEGEPMQEESSDESADVTEETEGDESDAESDVLDEGTSEEQSDDDDEPDNVVYAEEGDDSDVTDEGVVVEQSEEESDVADEGVEDKTDEEVEEDNEEESDEEESEKDKTEKFSKSRNLPSTRTIKSLATPVRKSIIGTVDKPPFTVAVGQSRGMHDEVMKAIQEVYDSEPQDIDMNTDPREYVKKDREMLELMKKGNLFEL